jgi:hypothetical protein
MIPHLELYCTYLSIARHPRGFIHHATSSIPDRSTQIPFFELQLPCSKNSRTSTCLRFPEHAIELPSASNSRQHYLNLLSTILDFSGPYELEPKPFINGNIRFSYRSKQITSHTISVRLQSEISPMRIQYL